MAPFVDWVKSWLDLEEKKSEMNEKQDTVDQNPLNQNPLVSICILTRRKGSPKYHVTRTNIPRYYALNRPIRHIYLTIL